MSNGDKSIDFGIKSKRLRKGLSRNFGVNACVPLTDVRNVPRVSSGKGQTKLGRQLTESLMWLLKTKGVHNKEFRQQCSTAFFRGFV